MKAQLRWLAVLPGAIAGWFIALAVGMVLLNVATELCPAGFLISGSCTAPWFDYVERGVTFFGVGLAAVLVVAFPALIAPSHRNFVAWSAFGMGAIAAVSMGWEMMPELLTALACGILAALCVSRATRARRDA